MLYGGKTTHYAGEEPIDFEDKDCSNQKKKGVLSCAKQNPRVTMKISEDKILGEKDFHGIKVDGTLPELYDGTDAAYYIDNEYLNRVEPSFLEKVELLANMASGDRFSFCVGRNRMTEFYSRVLPQFQEIADVSETDPEKFHAYVMPEAHFLFYLDATENDVVCKAYARYGERDFSLLDVLNQRTRLAMEAFRDESREEEVLYHVMQWLPEVDWEKGELCCGEDEIRIYQLMKNGTEKLMELNISTEDVPEEELLEILKSYHTRKKYYRLKDGSFVDLEEPSLEMLSELSRAMNLKDKEFLKKKLRLPMYRTLYLDKLLEENEDVYSTRDSRFREVVKEFKTVKVIHSRIRYALTGTPIENRLSELWSIFDYLMPGFLYGYEVFKKEMETPIVKNNDEQAMKRLQKMVGPFILRCLKEDVLKDLPEKLELLEA